MDENDELLDAITALIPSVLTALEAFAYFGRHMHPGNIQALVPPLKERVEPVEEGLKVFKGAPWPDHLQQFADQISEVAGHVISAIDGLKTIGDDEKSVFRAYRIMRYHNRAVESLYPIALMLPPVSRFLLNQVGGMMRCCRKNLRSPMRDVRTSELFIWVMIKRVRAVFLCMCPNIMKRLILPH